MNAIYVTSIFTKTLNVNNAVLYAALPASTVSILQITTIAQYAVFEIKNNIIYII
jgi:hypothetical protein